MRLKISLPSGAFMDEETIKIVAESPRGEFCLLPRHVDYVTALIPGILSYHTAQGEEVFLAVDHGILVKQGDHVFVSARHALQGALGELDTEVDRMISEVDEKETATRTSVARLEAGFVRRFLEFGKSG
jgi:F-type H+-transporting ATPase subunit epsilon